MKFLWTTIYVSNLEKSIAFYEKLVGLRVVRHFPAGPGMEIAFMGNGTENETLVELLADSNAGTTPYGEGISIGFAVDSVDGMLETVQRHNIPVLRGPIDIPGGSRFFCVKDPDGLTVQFFQQA